MPGHKDYIPLDLPTFKSSDHRMSQRMVWNMIMERLEAAWVKLQRTNDERIKRVIEEALAERESR